MEKIKEYLSTYKYPLIGLGVLLLLSAGYSHFKKDNNEEIEDKKSEKTKTELSVVSVIQKELRKLNQSLIKLNPGVIKDKETTEYYDKLFKKDINKKGILIDSISIPHDSNHNTSDYKVTFGTDNAPEVYKNVIGFRLVKATLPHVAHQVNDNNNSFIVNYSGTEHTITLTNGSYTFTELGNHIVNTLNAVSGISGFSITSSTISYKYTLTNSTNNFFKWKSSSSTAYRLFGALNIDETSSDYSSDRTFPHIVDQSKHFVDLVIPEIPAIACKASSNGKQVIDRIPLTSPSGSLVYYLAPITEYSSIDYFYPMKLSNLTIQLYDNDSNQLYDSQNGDNYFEFEITLLNDTSKMN
jgi:hypothetical protein